VIAREPLEQRYWAITDRPLQSARYIALLA
jgi:hypothetical protein